MTINAKDKQPVTLPTPKFWGVMPAAGVGARMGLDFPKQYLSLAGKTIIEHSIALMLTLDHLEQLVVCISDADAQFGELKLGDSRVVSTIGGASRAASVLRGLAELNSMAEKSDWVLVHDAARPCLDEPILHDLVESLQDEEVGGILAVEARDTLKLAQTKGSENYIQQTLDREKIWQAQTPQMFRYGALFDALKFCLDNDLAVTDEASALEHMGLPVKLVRGSTNNIKVTNPEDQRLAELLLKK